MRKTKRFVGVLLSFMLILAGFPQMKAKAAEPQSVEYLDEAGVSQTCTAAYAVDAVANEWGISETTTWLFVSRSMDIEDIRPSVKGTVNLILYDGAELVVREGIMVSVGNALNIFCQSAGTGQLLAGGHYEGETLQIDCEDSFAGIGGSYRTSTGNITMNGGKVTAAGGRLGAGIGGGLEEAGGNITINGGTVIASSREFGAGIGGGQKGAGGTITIKGGRVSATGKSLGAGIGGGDQGEGGTITITKGEVTAIGGEYGAGIGGGSSKAGGTINIDGGTITANGGTSSAGIGGGCIGAGGNITITGGEVTATGATYGAGIGGGHEGGNITISGGNVTAQGGDGSGRGDGGAGIGGGYNKAGGTITISEGTVTATGGGGAAGIGGGANGTGGNITINGGTVSATGGDDQNRAYSGDGGNSQGTLTVAPSSRVFADINPIVGMPSNREIFPNYEYKIDESDLCQYMKVVNAYKYLDWDETDKKTVEKMISFSRCSNVAAGESAWNNGWYVVKEDVVIDHRVTVTGMVHLLLCDGATLIAKKGITVADGNLLTIYGQSEGDGLLCAGIYSESGQLMPVCDSYNAGIGGENGENGGNITVHGGEVYACGGVGGAGIGGGFGGAGGTFRISGGQVCGYGGNLAAGIGGGGNGGAGGTINIFGGSIEAAGGAGAAGIGGGYNGDGGSIDISSGEVIALGGDYGGYAIGCGCPEEGTRLTANISFGEVKVSIFDGTTNEKIPQKASDRLAACAYGRVSVEPCAHDSKVGNSCKYCGCQLGGSTGGEIPFIPEEIITFCTVKFDADGGSAVSDKTVKKGMPIGMLPVTTREGFVFDGWYDGETKWTEETRVSQDVTLKAHWIEDKTILTEDMVTLSFEKKMYSGKKIEPQVTVKKDELILQPDIDYSVTYENNKNIGRARVIITGLGKYTGTVEKTFEITPPKAGSEFTRNNNLYRIVDAEKHTVSFCGTMGRGRIFTRNSIMIGGVSYSVTEIAKKALYKKEGITTLVIGKKVAWIGEKALYRCRNLKKLTFKTTLLKAKTVGENAFGRLSGKLRVEVPEEMKEKYAKFFYKKGLAKSIGLNE